MTTNPFHAPSRQSGQIARRSTAWEDRHGLHQVAFFDEIAWQDGTVSFEVIVFNKRRQVATQVELNRFAAMSPEDLAAHFSR